MDRAAPAPTPFRTILVANRGEIALRVMRTARVMGYSTVAVYSSADVDAPHVHAADQAVHIGDARPAQSYLRIESIIAAAKSTGADAIHPGYGFLAENDAFSRACREAGLVFIGPSPDAMRAMANKAGAKQRMAAAGVPCVPGFHGAQDTDTLSAEAHRIGFPVMIKATAGGGGRGMRRVERAEDFAAALHSAQSEAQAAFGDAEVILERALVNPRHIEIQVLVDRHGNAIHLGERDCSVQRRHQKLIEEAPSPAVSPALRAEMGAISVKAALAIGYEGAGTLEFLLDEAGRFYFMEMNTRLQVEHGVTEAITGLDLVELQLRVAAGEALPLTQGDVRFHGHAMEVRLCAEDPDAGFMPQSGRMGLWRMPTNVRVDHALQSGSDVPPYYDSMIAKLIAHGSTRDEARRSLSAALDDAVALGVRTNRGFLARCLEHPAFARGDTSTGFISAHGEALLQPRSEDEFSALAIAAVLTQVRDQPPGLPDSLAHRFRMDLRLELRMQLRNVLLQRLDGIHRYEVRIGDRTLVLGMLGANVNLLRCECAGVVESIAWLRDAQTLMFRFRGVDYTVQDRTLSAVVAAGGVSDGRIRASMNGRIVAVHALIGDLLAAGQPVFTLEAMKMEHTHTAPIAGRLKKLDVALNDQVGAARVVAEIEPVAAAEMTA